MILCRIRRVRDDAVSACAVNFRLSPSDEWPQILKKTTDAMQKEKKEKKARKKVGYKHAPRGS
jgi:hypothetical protein